MNVLVNGVTYPCTKAVKGTDYIELYDGNNKIAIFTGITDFAGYSITGGEWDTTTAIISELKTQLQTTDYKVIKQSEAICASISPLPYTTAEMVILYAERQALRDKINELEGSV